LYRTDCVHELVEASRHDSHWVFINKGGWPPFHDLGCFVHLEMYRPLRGVVIVLMPTQEEISLRLDPFEPVEVVVCHTFYVEADFEPCRTRWIRSVI